jgi:hypothetical protein
MRIPVWLTALSALVALAVVFFAGQWLLEPDRPLIASAGFSLDTITPNADGSEDIAIFSYEVTRDATVSIFLTLTDNPEVEFFFRNQVDRAADKYSVYFSGIVDGFVLPDEQIEGEVISRLIPNGAYTWTVRAVADDDGEVMEKTGTLNVTDGDEVLPDMIDFSVSPQIFTPNQDGRGDRVQISVYLLKEADLTVHLVSETGEELFMPRREGGREAGEAGRQEFDYEGGVDIGADPPPDGTYTVVARTQDAEGQIVERRSTLTIEQGGKPLAEIVGQPIGPDVIFVARPYEDNYFTSVDVTGERIDMPTGSDTLSVEAVTMQLGDLLVFSLVVENYGSSPIRTDGPFPGTVYQQEQRYGAMGPLGGDGVWRVGIQCESAAESYPWRWAIGIPDDLYTEEAPDGELYYYLEPGERSVTWGAIRMTELVDGWNPQECWAGLIHEGVGISLANTVVGPREIALIDSTPVETE